MDHFEYRAGRLHCDGIPASDIADRFGTPTYVYSASTLRLHYRRLAAAFGDLDPLVCYSVKSCPSLAVCSLLVELGAGLDVVSGGELERAFLCGCPMSRVVYAGVGKTAAELRAALDGRWSPLADDRDGLPDPAPRGAIGWLNIESEPEFEAASAIAAELGVTTHAALRVNPDVDARTHAYTTTGTKETKFGVAIGDAAGFFDRHARGGPLTLDALHLHLGSPVYEPGPYREALERTLALADGLSRRGFDVRTLDLGGGFGADYETDRSPPAAAYAAEIVPLLRDRVRGGLRVILEPGRTITANAGVLLTRVIYVKRTPTRTFLITDAGMNALIRPALYGAFHFIWPADPPPGFVPPRRAQRPDLAGLAPADVVGPLCETGDFLARDRPMPPVAAGDLLAVFTAGAYGMSMASQYNSRPLPAEVLADGDDARLVRRRQTVLGMMSDELAVYPPRGPYTPP